MKHPLSFKYIILTVLSSILLLTMPETAEASALYPFSNHSVLGTGKWVKVEIDETGIYEISYDELRAMGFAEPSRVGVWGKGGTALPYTFVESSKPVMTDDLAPIGVWHNNDRLYFYGRGCEEIAFSKSSQIFEKKSLNIYSTIGAYFLSECEEPLSMTEYTIPSANANLYELGYDYIYREADLHQNTTNTGNVFWGEDLLGEKNGYNWKYSLPLLDTNSAVKLDVKVYAADKSTGTLHYGLQGATSGNQSFTIKHPKAFTGTKVNPEYATMSTPVASTFIGSTEPDVYVRTEGASGSFVNLDYWILTYSKNIPDFSVSTHSQERLTLTPKAASPGKIQIASKENVAVFDVTKPATPGLLAKKETSGATEFIFPSGDNLKNLVVCDLTRAQKKIRGYQQIESRDLHAAMGEGADLLIITVPRYLDFAERLADLHRQHQNISVFVATTPEVYNEFSGGIPDPMAYRAMMKMCYENSGEKMKNLLLVGPVAGNFRMMASGEDRDNFIIGFQDLKVTTETHAANAMDFYGFANNTTYTALQNNKMHVGVGLLPFFSEAEASTYLTKVENYLTDPDKATLVNEYMSMGGVGDNHTHDLQAVQLSEYRSQYYPVKHPDCIVAFDAFGEKESKNKLYKELRYGKLFTTYFGHGTSLGINVTQDIFQNNDLPKLRNRQPAFMMICACDISGTDFLKKGFGELLVTNTAGGTMATIFSTRTAWSGQNYELTKHISSWMYASPETYTDPVDASIKRTLYRASSPTIGEVFALAKSSSNYSNSTSYILVGDPALTVPVPLSRISAAAEKTGSAGTRFKIRGTVMTRDSIHLRDTLPPDHYLLPTDKKYNGKIVAKLRAPEKVNKSADYISNTSATGKTLYVPYNDETITEYTTPVKEGIYEFDYALPEELVQYAGEEVQVFLSSYDPTQDLAASGYLTFKVTTSSADPSTVDATPPTINAIYDDANRLMTISIYDEGGIASDCITTLVDQQVVRPTPMLDNEDNRERAFNLFTDHFSIGEHSLKIEATDIAGNKCEKEITFGISYQAPTHTLLCDRKAVISDILFYFEESHPENAILQVYDMKENLIFSTPLDDNSYFWNCLKNDGSKVGKGLYKAVVKTAGSGEENQFSNTVRFAIIE